MSGVPGRGGPVPKRSDQRHGHRSKADREAVTKVQVAAPVVAAPEPDETWHPIARDWFASLGKSGQSGLYEPSDWATARYVAEAMSRNLMDGKFSAMLFASVMSASVSLLVTEGDRRRVRLELERAPVQDADEDAAVTALNTWRDRFSS